MTCRLLEQCLGFHVFRVSDHQRAQCCKPGLIGLCQPVFDPPRLLVHDLHHMAAQGSRGCASIELSLHKVGQLQAQPSTAALVTRWEAPAPHLTAVAIRPPTQADAARAHDQHRTGLPLVSTEQTGEGITVYHQAPKTGLKRKKIGSP